MRTVRYLRSLTEDIATRYEEVILASGDGIFARAVAELEAEGVVMTVLGRSGSIARSLELAASRVVYMPRERLTADRRATA